MSAERILGTQPSADSVTITLPNATTEAVSRALRPLGLHQLTDYHAMSITGRPDGQVDVCIGWRRAMSPVVREILPLVVLVSWSQARTFTGGKT